jgi:hypothetical protein
MKQGELSLGELSLGGWYQSYGDVDSGDRPSVYINTKFSGLLNIGAERSRFETRFAINKATRVIRG